MVECSAYFKEAVDDVNGKISWCPVMNNLNAKLRRLYFTL